MPEQEAYRITLDDFYKLPSNSIANLLDNHTVVIRDNIVHVFVDMEEKDPDALQPEDMF